MAERGYSSSSTQSSLAREFTEYLNFNAELLHQSSEDSDEYSSSSSSTNTRKRKVKKKTARNYGTPTKKSKKGINPMSIIELLINSKPVQQVTVESGANYKCNFVEEGGNCNVVESGGRCNFAEAGGEYYENYYNDQPESPPPPYATGCNGCATAMQFINIPGATLNQQTMENHGYQRHNNGEWDFQITNLRTNEVIRFKVNFGKNYALRFGFQKAFKYWTSHCRDSMKEFYTNKNNNKRMRNIINKNNRKKKMIYRKKIG
eukprot:731081_1